MKHSWLSNLLGLKSASGHKERLETVARTRLEFDTFPNRVYAIGDLHGCFDLLLDLEAQIATDCAKSKVPALIIMLGDYVDRGPQTSAIIDHLLEPPPFNASRICLAGNHEEMMLAFIENPKLNNSWLEHGGQETLASYGLHQKELKAANTKKRNLFYKINSYVPHEHVEFLRDLPIFASFPDRLFVHAGIRPGLSLDEQTDRDLIWIREDFLKSTAEPDYLVVHGHSPVDSPYLSPKRINVDTGAYMNGKLTAAKFTNGKFAEFLTT